jgi:hypothetical protein
MSCEEMAANFDTVALHATEIPMSFRMQPELNAQAGRALFDEKTIQCLFPRVDVVLLLCEQTVWQCVYGFMETKRVYRECLHHGKQVRRVRFVQIPGSNHFVSEHL